MPTVSYPASRGPSIFLDKLRRGRDLLFPTYLGWSKSLCSQDNCVPTKNNFLKLTKLCADQGKLGFFSPKNWQQILHLHDNSWQKFLATWSHPSSWVTELYFSLSQGANYQNHLPHLNRTFYSNAFPTLYRIKDSIRHTKHSMDVSVRSLIWLNFKDVENIISMTNISREGTSPKQTFHLH